MGCIPCKNSRDVNENDLRGQHCDRDEKYGGRGLRGGGRLSVPEGSGACAARRAKRHDAKGYTPTGYLKRVAIPVDRVSILYL